MLYIGSGFCQILSRKGSGRYRLRSINYVLLDDQETPFSAREDNKEDQTVSKLTISE